MKKYIDKILWIVFFMTMFLIILTIKSNAATLTITPSTKTVQPGKSFTITIKVSGGAGYATISAQNATLSKTSTNFLDNSSETITCTAGSKNGAIITITANAILGDYETEKDESKSASASITIKSEQTTQKTTTTNKSTTSTSSQTTSKSTTTTSSKTTTTNKSTTGTSSKTNTTTNTIANTTSQNTVNNVETKNETIDNNITNEEAINTSTEQEQNEEETEEKSKEEIIVSMPLGAFIALEAGIIVVEALIICLVPWEEILKKAKRHNNI